VKLKGFTDTDWVGSPYDRKIKLGVIFSIGSAVVSWYNMKQRSVALSSRKAKYMAASQETCETI